MLNRKDRLSYNVIFKFHQNKYPEDASRIFTRALTPDSRWLDDELNPM